HTRSKRDWSSDVCSSDLVDLVLVEVGRLRLRLADQHQQALGLLLALLPLRLRQALRLLLEALAEALRRLLGEAPPALRAQQQVQIGRASCRERVERPVGG